MKIVYSKDRLLRAKEVENLISFLSAYEKGDDIYLSTTAQGIAFNLYEPLIEKVITSIPGAENKEKIKSDIRDIIAYLNFCTGKRFSNTAKANVELITPRLKEYSVDDFKVLIDNKIADWADTPEMAKYLRPETLFAKRHFESYLNEKSVEQAENDLFSELENYKVEGN